MKAVLFALFVALLMVGCGEQAQKEAVEGESEETNDSHVDHSGKPKEDSAEIVDLLVEDEPPNADLNSSLLTSCEACSRKVSVLSEACVGCGHPVGAMRKLGEDLVEGLAEDFKEYKSWKARKKELDKELEDLREEARADRVFLERLRRDPEYREAIQRKELGYGKTNERLYRLPEADDEPPDNPNP